MKVILLSELKGRGGEGDVIEVARGFANNYLLPQGIAILATKGNLKQLEMRRKNIAKREETRIANAEELKAKLDELIVKVDAKVGEEGVLFGSVTPPMIADSLKEQFDIEIDRKRIDLKHPIKTAGQHEVLVSLYREIKSELKVYVGAEGEAVPTEEELAAEEAAEAVEETVEAAQAEAAEEATEAPAEAEAEAAEEAAEAPAEEAAEE